MLLVVRCYSKYFTNINSFSHSNSFMSMIYYHSSHFMRQREFTHLLKSLRSSESGIKTDSFVLNLYSLRHNSELPLRKGRMRWRKREEEGKRLILLSSLISTLFIFYLSSRTLEITSLFCF